MLPVLIKYHHQQSIFTQKIQTPPKVQYQHYQMQNKMNTFGNRTKVNISALYVYEKPKIKQNPWLVNIEKRYILRTILSRRRKRMSVINQRLK